MSLTHRRVISPRSTIYWNPVMKVENSNELQIRVAENSQCIVEVEGLTKDGECVYLQDELK